MAYTDSTLSRKAVAARMTTGCDAEMDAQPGVDGGRGRVVYLRIYENGRKAVYKIPLEEWSRLNRDAVKTP